MERSVSIYGSTSALRGVQLKIGEKFKPPAKITLPVGWKTRDPSKILRLTYDFSLEDDVLQKALAEKLAKEQDVAKKVREEQESPKPVIACMGGDILQPTSAMSGVTSQKETKEKFNYKDFEGDTDTPFELVELQSINNMDALKSILQPGISEIPVSNSANNTSQNRQTNNGLNEQHVDRQINYMATGNIPTTKATTNVHYNQPNTNQFLQDTSLNSHTQHVNQDMNLRHDLQPFGSTSVNSLNVSCPESNTIPQNSINSAALPLEKISLPGAMKVLPGPPPAKPLPQRPPPRRPRSVSSDTLTTDSPTIEGASATVSAKPIPKPRSKLPPIKKDVDPTIPPPLPPKKSPKKVQSFENRNNFFKDEKHVKRYQSPLPRISPPVTPMPCSTRPDPLLSMSSDEIQFAHGLSAMGFPLERVARAVKNFGCKEREVVEYLILFGELCTRGYSEHQVEMVLKESDSNKEKAEKFLSLIAQFKELGFQEEQIFTALKESECDSNKTLDILTCAG